jgi:hypothetical protein
MLWLLSLTAWAADPPAEPTVSVAVGAALVGEAAQDQAITLVYGSTSLSGEGSATLRFRHGIETTIRVGFRRRGGVEVDEGGLAVGPGTWIWYAPIAWTGGISRPVGQASAFVGLGPAVVPWSEAPDPTADFGSTGGKFGLLLDAGLRIPVPGIGPSLYDPERGVQAVEIELGAGYRYTFRSRMACAEPPCGLDFSSLRLSAGARVVF